jgi:hypothetical protein
VERVAQAVALAWVDLREAAGQAVGRPAQVRDVPAALQASDLRQDLLVAVPELALERDQARDVLAVLVPEPAVLPVRDVAPAPL